MSSPYRSTPVFWVLFGGLVALGLLRLLFAASFLPLVLIGSILGFGFCLVVSFGRSASPVVLLFLFGFSGFLVYGSYLSYRAQVTRHWLLNRRLSLEATWKPPNRLEVERVNGDPYRTRLYFNPESVRNDLMQYRWEGRVGLAATGSVNWYGIAPDFRRFLFQRGFGGLFEPGRLHSLEVSPVKGGKDLRGIRKQLDQYLQRLRPRAPTSVALLRALMLGTKEFSNNLTTLLRRLGLYHLFVISGLHVGVIFYCFWSLLDGIPELARGSITGLGLVAYVSFLGWPIPATRAMFMIGIGGLSSYLDRRSSLFDILCLTVLVFMIWDPFVVFEVGFQLSVGAVLGIVLVRPIVEDLTPRWWVRLALISLGAYSGVFPVLLYHFGYISPLALPGSFAGTLMFPLLVGLLTLQLIFLSVSWSVPYEVIEQGLNRAVFTGSELLSAWCYVLELPAVSVPTVGVIALILYLILRPRSRLLTRLCSASLLVGGLWVGQTTAPVPSLMVQKTGENPSVLFTTRDGDRGLLLPAGVRLDTFSFESLVRRLKSMGIHHLDIFIGDYSREMIHRVDPPITIGTVVTSWRRVGDLSYGDIRIGKGFATISTGSFGIRFKGRTPGGLSLRSNAIGAVTSTSNCLIVNSSVVRRKAFRELRTSGCEPLFLEDSPVRFNFRGRVIGRRPGVNAGFASRVLRTVFFEIFFTGTEN